MVEAVKRNYPQREIADAAFALQQEIDAGERDRRRRQPLRAPRTSSRSPRCASTRRSKRKQIDRLQGARARRDGAAVERPLAALREDAAHEERNLMEPLLACARAHASEGEIDRVAAAGVRRLHRDARLLERGVASANHRRWGRGQPPEASRRTSCGATCCRGCYAAARPRWRSPPGGSPPSRPPTARRPPPAACRARSTARRVLPGTSLAVSPAARLLRRLAALPRSACWACRPRRWRSVRVSGSRSGSHAGRLRGYSQGDGASFVPSRPFSAGETVTVRGLIESAHAPGASSSTSWSPQQDVLPYSTPTPPSGKDPNEKQHFHSRPDLEAAGDGRHRALTARAAPATSSPPPTTARVRPAR